jgi:hypothetical protein
MNLITKFLTLHNQLKVYHWQTDSYAQHLAFGGAYNEFTDLIDTFIEEFMGQYSRIMNKDGFKVELYNITDNDASVMGHWLLILDSSGSEHRFVDHVFLNIGYESQADLQYLKR